MKLLIIIAALVATAQASCPNACSGHGSCGLASLCKCQARWVGNDCSSRQCPSGVSWVSATPDEGIPAGGALGGLHPYAECSGRGKCDRDSGECACFEGYAGRGCRRTSCPNACSGHGQCRFNYEINAAYTGYGSLSKQTQFASQDWDAAKTRQCQCDRGYEGVDCASRMCPKGDDPLTNCNDNATPGESVDDTQVISMQSGTIGAGKFFTLMFKDMYNGEYTTRPISTANAWTTPAATTTTACVWASAACGLSGADEVGCVNGKAVYDFCSGHTSQVLCEAATYEKIDTAATFTDGANNALGMDVEAALEELPNFAIPNVTQTLEWDATMCRVLIKVTFVDEANSGKQHKLVPSVTSATIDHDKAYMQPRFNAVLTTPTVTHADVADIDKYEEHTECANRGSCDSDSGLCACYEGFTGEACQKQTVFF